MRQVAASSGAVLLALSMLETASAQELEPRAYSPSPVGTTFVLGGFGRSEGDILFDPSLNIVNVQADLWITTTGIAHTFGLMARQARMLAVFPAACGTIAGNVGDQAQRQHVRGLVDPRFKLTVGLRAMPAVSLSQFARTPRRAAIGASVTVAAPWGQYDGDRLVHLGYNRWDVKPEIGVSQPLGRWTVEGYVGVWAFTTNTAYYPGNLQKRQDPVLAMQGHVSYTLPRRYWIAIDGTWFAGSETRVAGALNSDLQRNTRLGSTLSVPIVGQQSVKFVYSTGTTTRRGSDFNTFNATWRLVMF